MDVLMGYARDASRAEVSGAANQLRRTPSLVLAFLSGWLGAGQSTDVSGVHMCLNMYACLRVCR